MRIKDLFGEQIKQLTLGNAWPDVRVIDVSNDEATLLMRVDSSVEWFAGHFPENPVLPGVVQIHWAARILKVIFTELSGFSAITNLKFNNVILPGSRVTLKLRYNKEKKSVRFTYCHGEKMYSSGTLVFSAL